MFNRQLFGMRSGQYKIKFRHQQNRWWRGNCTQWIPVASVNQSRDDQRWKCLVRRKFDSWSVDPNSRPLPWVVSSTSFFKTKFNLIHSHTRQQVKKISVYLGVHNYAETDEVNRKLYSVNNYIIHPDWNVNNYYSNDIALIKLSTTVTFTRKLIN